MGTLKIERTGGFGGFGVGQSRVKSSGEQAVSALSAADQAAVEALFKNPKLRQGSGLESHPFRYRITRTMGGKEQSIDDVAETAVPDALKACVTDKLT